jgi:pimeloyl-ACP methyl ester carboxylesterase
MRLRQVLGVGVLGWLAWRLFGPELVPRFETPQERPNRIAGRSVLVGQRELFVREAGSPAERPVVLLHGWAYDSLATWHKVLGPLAERYRVVAIDQRNHGRSERVRGSFDIEDVADEVAGVMDAVGVPRAAVVGYSMGGMVAQALAFRHPEKVERLVLGATAAYPLSRRRGAMRIGFALARALGRISLVEWSRATVSYLIQHGALEPRHARWMWGSLLDRDMSLSFEAGHAILRFDSRSWVGRIGVPALVVIPTEDQLVDPSSQRELADLLDEAMIVEVVGARHEAVLTHADDIVKAIEGFVG